MTETAVTLSNESTIQVKRLGLFELDANVGKPPTDYYTIEQELPGGKVHRQFYDVSYDRPKPDTPIDECQEGSSDWWDWQEYYLWQKGLLFYREQMNALSEYFANIEAYILANCVAEDDRNLIETWQDFDKVYQAALPNLPTVEDLEAVANSVFQAKWGEVSVFKAFLDLEGSEGSYAWMPQKTFELMIKLGETEDQFLNRSKNEIAMMMVADLLPGMLTSLQTDKQYKEMKAKNDVATG